MGTDKIQTEVWKKGLAVLAGPIAHICNISISVGVYPTMFKEAIVHPVFKKGNPHAPGSYRPISILPSLRKYLRLQSVMHFLTG